VTPTLSTLAAITNGEDAPQDAIQDAMVPLNDDNGDIMMTLFEEMANLAQACCVCVMVLS
jgi:hypothetical protein